MTPTPPPIAALALLAAFAAAAPAAAMAPEPETVRQICHLYDNKARFLPRTGDVAPVARLADSCALAAATLAEPDAPPSRRAVAATFLASFAEARATIDAINAERIGRAFAAGAAQRPGRMVDLAEAAGLVTETGEYLILRHAGVLDALEAWTATALAAADAAPPPW